MQASEPELRVFKAFQSLRDSLQKAQAQYDTAGDDETRRLAMSKQILSLVDFTQHCGFPTALTVAATRAATAILGLNEGMRDGVLVAKVPNRPKDPAHIVQFKGRAAAAMEVLVRAGEPEKEANRWVAREINRAQPTSVTGANIDSWRKRAREGDAQTDLLTYEYQTLLEIRDANPSESPRDFALRLITQLPPLPPPKR